jgi:hypothetical protein
MLTALSAGGLVALGLGVKNWTIDECAQKFQDLCSTAFAPREFHNIPGVQQVTNFFQKAKYRTKPFEIALKELFCEDQLFGGACEEQRYQRKVAVVSTCGTGQKAVLLTNYNRAQRDAEPGKPSIPKLLHLANAFSDYKFERPEKGQAELKTWEASVAISLSLPKLLR